MLILNDAAIPWTVTRLEALTPDDFAGILAAGPAVVEFVLLGTGATQALPPKPVLEALKAAGIGLEVMNTEAAARTYNVLASQGRRLAAALIAL